MSKFYNYSVNNCMLINNQFEGGLAVGSYDFWKKQGYTVQKGEKGIKIICFINSDSEVDVISSVYYEIFGISLNNELEMEL